MRLTHIVAICLLMMLITMPVLLLVKKTHQESLHEELAARSDAHALLIPAYFKCRAGSFFDDGPVATCLGELSSVANDLDLSSSFPEIKQDLLDYEQQDNRWYMVHSAPHLEAK